MKKIAVLLSLGVFLTVSCEKREHKPQVSNVSFTPCLQTKATKSELSDRVDVEFTNQGVKITHNNFGVTCDFTIVNVTHTFVSGVLRITQQGSPSQANCICYTDVSYTIDGISQNEVNVIFINDEQVYCHNDNAQSNGECEDMAKADFHINEEYLYPSPPIMLENLIPLPDRDKLIYLWSWTERGSNVDNIFSSSVHPNPIIIANWGIFDITMKIMLPNSICTDSKTITIKIIPPPADAFFEDIEPGNAPYEVQFINASRYAVAYKWDFGDGYISNQREPKHTFMMPGTYDVTLIVYGEDMTSTRITKQVVVL